MGIRDQNATRLEAQNEGVEWGTLEVGRERAERPRRKATENEKGTHKCMGSHAREVTHFE